MSVSDSVKKTYPLDVAEQLIAQGYNLAILNLASAKRPCGGWDAGMGAQEESLYRCNTI